MKDDACASGASLNGPLRKLRFSGGEGCIPSAHVAVGCVDLSAQAAGIIRLTFLTAFSAKTLDSRQRFRQRCLSFAIPEYSLAIKGPCCRLSFFVGSHMTSSETCLFISSAMTSDFNQSFRQRRPISAIRERLLAAIGPYCRTIGENAPSLPNRLYA